MENSVYKKITIRDLAKKLKLSPATVSRGLNNFPEIKEQTRKRIHKVAKELGYRPNLNAQRLANGKNNAIGLVMPFKHDISHEPLFNEFISGILNHSAIGQTDVVLIPTLENNELDIYKNAIMQNGVDGLIITSPYLEDDRIKILQDHGMPFIVHGRSLDNQFNWMDVNNRESFLHATNYLIEKGHSNIALITGKLRFTFTNHRIEGYKQALTNHKIEIQDDLIATDFMTESAGYRYAYDFLSRKDRPTAILSSSMFSTLGILRAARELSLEYPKDFSIITYDDQTSYLKAEFFHPGMTTITSSLKDAGYRCAELLNDLTNGSKLSQINELWETEFIERDSVKTNPT